MKAIRVFVVENIVNCIIERPLYSKGKTSGLLVLYIVTKHCFLLVKHRGALSCVSDGDVRTRPSKERSFGDRLNNEKRGSFTEDKRKIGGHLVRTITKKGVFQ